MALKSLFLRFLEKFKGKVSSKIERDLVKKALAFLTTLSTDPLSTPQINNKKETDAAATMKSLENEWESLKNTRRDRSKFLEEEFSAIT